MAIRTLKWTVGENMEVSPTSIQKAGVQGDHLATCVEFTVPESLQNGYVLYIQFVSSTGAYDKSDELMTVDGKVSFLLPLAWTQDGGMATLRLVATKDDVPEGVEPETVYSTDGRIVFEEHQTGFARVKSLISGAINRLMELAKKAKDDAAESASLAQEAERQSKEASDAAKEAAAGALTNAQSAEESAGQAKSYLDETIYGYNAVMTMRDEVSGKAEQAETSARIAEESAASVAADLQESIKSAAAAAISEQNSQNSAASAYESEQNSQQSATSAADSAQRAEAASAIALEAKEKAEQSAASINTVDQTFDPLSENPQSGVAVAEAIRTVKTPLRTHWTMLDAGNTEISIDLVTDYGAHYVVYSVNVKKSTGEEILCDVDIHDSTNGGSEGYGDVTVRLSEPLDMPVVIRIMYTEGVL